MRPRLKIHYEDTVVPNLLEEFGYENIHQVPKLEKIILNCGIGDAAEDRKLLDSVVDEIAAISGQKPVVTRAKKSVAAFGIREGMPVGVRVTLRRVRMWEFLDRFLNVAVPRIRDFRGLPTRSFDGRGNYTVGIEEHTVFPEIDIDEVRKMHGLDVTFVTSTTKDDEAYALFRELGFPFKGATPVVVSGEALSGAEA